MLKIFAYAAPRTGNGSKQWPRPVTNASARVPVQTRRAQARPNQTKGKKFARKAFKNVPINCTKKVGTTLWVLIKNWKWVRCELDSDIASQGRWQSGEVQRVLLFHVHCLFPSIVMEHLWKSRDRNLCNSLTKWVKCFKIWQHSCDCIRTINNLMTATSGPYNIHM